MCGYAIREKASTLTDNLRRDERLRGLDVDQVAGPNARSMMSAPLLVQGEPIGTLCAIRLDDAEPFGDRELGVLNMLSGQASIAIENAHNFEDRKRRITELSTLNQTGQALSSTLKKDDLIQLIYNQVARVMDARTFYIALYDAARDQISFPLAYEQGVCKAWPSTGPNSEEWLPRRGRKGLTEHVLQTRKPLHLPNQIIARMAELGIERIGHPSLSWLGVPILWDDQPLGMIAVQSFERENAYDEAHVELLTTIASQAAVAMRNAQLFDEVNGMTENLETLVADRTEALAQANRDLTLERDRLNALYRIMRELSSSLELERLLNRTLVLINHALTAEQGYILIRDSGTTLVYRAVVGRTPHTLEGEPLALPRTRRVGPLSRGSGADRPPDVASQQRPDQRPRGDAPVGDQPRAVALAALGAGRAAPFGRRNTGLHSALPSRRRPLYPRSPAYARSDRFPDRGHGEQHRDL